MTKKDTETSSAKNETNQKPTFQTSNYFIRNW
jgi:hypothetical protein